MTEEAPLAPWKYKPFSQFFDSSSHQFFYMKIKMRVFEEPCYGVLWEPHHGFCVPGWEAGGQVLLAVWAVLDKSGEITLIGIFIDANILLVLTWIA